MTALEALKDIKDELWGHYRADDISDYSKNQFALIEKELKAFETIKKNLTDVGELQYDVVINGNHHLTWLVDDGEFVELNDGDSKTYTKEEIVGNHYQCFAGVWRDTGFVYVFKLNDKMCFEPLHQESK